VQGCIFDSGGTNQTDNAAWAFTVTPEDTKGTTASKVCLNQGAAPKEGSPIDANANNCIEAVKGVVGNSSANTAGTA